MGHDETGKGSREDTEQAQNSGRNESAAADRTDLVHLCVLSIPCASGHRPQRIEEFIQIALQAGI